MLFQLESAGGDADEALSYHAAEAGASAEVREFAAELIRGVLAHRDALDAVIADASEHWKLEQIARVERVILRIAAYELTVDRQVPTKAAINESIELAKTFSGDEAARFVNGVLGRVAAAAS